MFQLFLFWTGGWCTQRRDRCCTFQRFPLSGVILRLGLLRWVASMRGASGRGRKEFSFACARGCHNFHVIPNNVERVRREWRRLTVEREWRGIVVSSLYWDKITVQVQTCFASPQLQTPLLGHNNVPKTAKWMLHFFIVLQASFSSSTFPSFDEISS